LFLIFKKKDLKKIKENEVGEIYSISLQNKHLILVFGRKK